MNQKAKIDSQSTAISNYTSESMCLMMSSLHVRLLMC